MNENDDAMAPEQPEKEEISRLRGVLNVSEKKSARLENEVSKLKFQASLMREELEGLNDALSSASVAMQKLRRRTSEKIKGAVIIYNELKQDEGTGMLEVENL